MDRYTQLAMVAADEAVKDSGLNMEDEDPWKVGVITGSVSAVSILLRNSISHFLTEVRDV